MTTKLKFIGSLMLLSAMFCGSLSCQGQAPRRYEIKVVRSYPHDRSSYTQGLFFHNGILYESTGGWGRSTLRTNDLKSGKSLTMMHFANKYFCEGSTVLNGKLYLLTWTNKKVFVYDAESLEFQKAYSYPRQGWGLTTDGHSLIASDGSDKLYFMTPELQQERVLKVRLYGKPVTYLNELEWIDGKIWANVYLTSLIYIINPEDGCVEAVIYCQGLLPDELRTEDTDVLNGIACLDGRIFLTGKNWPKLYEIRLVEQH